MKRRWLGVFRRSPDPTSASTPRTSTFYGTQIGEIAGTVESSADVIWDETSQIGRISGHIEHHPRN